MADRLTLRQAPRSWGSGPVAPPLSWRPIRQQDGPDTALVTCDKGHWGLICNHEIDPQGEVSPSLICVEPTCGWHVWVRLEGWGERWARAPEPAGP